MEFLQKFYKAEECIYDELFCPKYSSDKLGETKLICWSTGRTDSALSKIKKIILQTYGQLAFVLIYYFLLFEKKKQKKKKHKKNTKHSKLI